MPPKKKPGAKKADIQDVGRGSDSGEAVAVAVAVMAGSDRKLRRRGREEDVSTEKMGAKPKKSPVWNVTPGVEEKGKPAKLRSGQARFQENNKEEDQIEFNCTQPSAVDEPPVPRQLYGQLSEGSNPGTSRKRKGGRGSLSTTTELPKKEVANCLVSRKKHRHETADINVSTEEVGALSSDLVDISGELFSKGAKSKRAEIERASGGGDTGEGVVMKASSERNLRHRGREEDVTDAKPKKSPGRKAKSGEEEGGKLAKLKKGLVCFQEKTKQEDQVEFKCVQYSSKEEACVFHPIDGQPAEGSTGTSGKRKGDMGSLSTTMELPRKEAANCLVSKKKHLHKTIEVNACTEEVGAPSRDPVDISRELFYKGAKKAEIEGGNRGGDTGGVEVTVNSKRNLRNREREENASMNKMDVKPRKSPGRKAKSGVEEGGQLAKIIRGQVGFQEKTKQEDQVEFKHVQSSPKEESHIPHPIDGQPAEGSSPGTSRKRNGGKETELPSKEVVNHLVSKKKKRHKMIEINASTEEVGALSRDTVDICEELCSEGAKKVEIEIGSDGGDTGAKVASSKRNLLHRGSEGDALTDSMDAKPKKRPGRKAKSGLEEGGQPAELRSGQVCFQEKTKQEDQLEFKCAQSSAKEETRVPHPICGQPPEGSSSPGTSRKRKGGRASLLETTELPRKEMGNLLVSKKKHRHETIDINVRTEEVGALSRDPVDRRGESFIEGALNAGDSSTGSQIPREDSVNAPKAPKNKRRHKVVEINAQSKEVETLSKDPTIISGKFLSESVVNAEGEHHHDKKDDPSVRIQILTKEWENGTVAAGNLDGKMDDPYMGLQIPREECVNAPHIPKNKRRLKMVEISVQSKEVETLSKNPTVITEHVVPVSVVNAAREHHLDRKDDPSVGIQILTKEGKNWTVNAGDLHGKMDDPSMCLQMPREESTNAPHIPKKKRRYKKAEIGAQSKEVEILSKDPMVITEQFLSESVVNAEGEHHHDKKDDPYLGIQILRKEGENGTDLHEKMDDPSMGLQIPRKESLNTPRISKNKRRHKKVEISAQRKEVEILPKDPMVITEQFLSENVIDAEGEHHHDKKDDPSVGIQILRKEGENGTTNDGNHHGKMDDPSTGLQIPSEENVNAPHMLKTKRRYKKSEISTQSKELQALSKDLRVITGQLLSGSVLIAGRDHHHDKKDNPSLGLQTLTKEGEHETVNAGDHQGEMDDPSMRLEIPREESVDAPHVPKNKHRHKMVEISAQSKEEVEILSKNPMVITAQFLSESVVNAGGEHQHGKKDDSSVSIQILRKEDKNGTVLKKKLKRKKNKTNARKEQLDALSTEQADINVQFLSESVANAGEPHAKMDNPLTGRQIISEEGMDDSVPQKKCKQKTVEISASTEEGDISGRLLAEDALSGGEQHEKMKDPSMGIQIPRKEVVNAPTPKRKHKCKTVEINASREEMDTLLKDPLDNARQFFCEGEKHQQTDDLSIMDIQLPGEEVLNKTVEISANTEDADISEQFLSEGGVNDGVKTQSLQSDLDEVINDQVHLEGTQSISAELQLNDSGTAKGSEGVRTSKRERKKSHRWLEYETSNMGYMQDAYAEILNPEHGTVDEDGTAVVKAEKKGWWQSDLKCGKKIDVPSNEEGQGLDETETAHDLTSGLSLDVFDTLTQQFSYNPEKPSKVWKSKSDHIKESPLGDSPKSHSRKPSKVHKKNFGHEKETPRKQKSKSVASSTDGSEKSAKKASRNGSKTEVERTKKEKRTISRGIKFVGNGDINPIDPDLDLSKLTMKEIIWVAEAKEKQLKENASSKEREAAGQTFASQTEELFQPEERASFAPQVQVIDGRIVINQESLTISAGRPNEVENFKRVEETHSKLNYHSYLKKLPRFTWTTEDTELFYKAIRQFGTDFGLIKNLFPGKSRRHIVLKFKKEERLHPLRLADAMTHKPEGTAEYEKVMNILNISLETATEQPNDTSEAWEDPFVTQANATEMAAEEELSGGIDLEEQSSPEAEKEKVKVESGSHDNGRVVGTKVEYSSSFNASVNIQEKYEAITQKSEDFTQKSELEDLGHLSLVSKPKSLFSYQNLNPSKPRSLFSYQQL